MTGLNSNEALQNLLEAREQFVRFLIPRVRSRAEAEDLVQASLLKALQTGAKPDAADSAVAWFYRILRNALVDHIRSQQSERRAMERHAQDQDVMEEHELEQVACQCIKALIPTLKQAEAEVILAVDLGGQTPAVYASQQGVTANAMTVRLHRARKALREKIERTCRTCATHGCLDCRCRSASEAQKNL